MVVEWREVIRNQTEPRVLAAVLQCLQYNKIVNYYCLRIGLIRKNIGIKLINRVYQSIGRSHIVLTAYWHSTDRLVAESYDIFELDSNERQIIVQFCLTGSAKHNSACGHKKKASPMWFDCSKFCQTVITWTYRYVAWSLRSFDEVACQCEASRCDGCVNNAVSAVFKFNFIPTNILMAIFIAVLNCDIQPHLPVKIDIALNRIFKYHSLTIHCVPLLNQNELNKNAFVSILVLFQRHLYIYYYTVKSVYFHE